MSARLPSSVRRSRAPRRRRAERGAVGQRIRVREAEVKDVRTGIDRGESDANARLGVRIAGDDVGDQGRRPAARASAKAAAMRRAPAVSFVPSVAPAAPRAHGAHAVGLDPAPNVARSLSPRPDSPTRTMASSGQSPPGAFGAGENARQGRERVGEFQGRQDPLGPRQPAHRRERFAIGRGGDLQPAGGRQRGDLRSDARIVEAGRRGVGLGDLAVAVLEHHRARPVEDPRRPAGERGGMAPGRDAFPCGFGDRDPDRGSPMNRSSRPIAFEPPPTQARARSGRRPSTSMIWAAASSRSAAGGRGRSSGRGAAPSRTRGRSGSSRRS